MTGGDATRTWQAAGTIDDLWEGDMAGAEVAGQPVLLVNLDGEVRAYRNRCPHQEWALDDGDLDETTLTCVRHLWSFDVSTGCGVNPADTRLVSYPCRVDEDGTIRVDVGGEP